MFIRWNDTTKLFEKDTSAGTDGSGPWTTLPIDITQLASYDTNTFVPALTWNVAGDQSFVYSVQVGNYTKIGNIVYFNIRIATSTSTHTTSTGGLSITGLPFTSVNVSNNLHSLSISTMQTFTLPANYSMYAARIPNNSTLISLIRLGSTVTGALLDATDHTSGTQIIIGLSGWYQI